MTTTQPVVARASTRAHQAPHKGKGMWGRLFAGPQDWQLHKHIGTLEEDLRIARAGATAVPALERDLAEQSVRLAGADALAAARLVYIGELEARVSQLEREHIDAGSLQQQLALADEAYTSLHAEYLRVNSELENLTPVTVAPGQRDTSVPAPVPPAYEQTLADLGYPPDPYLDGDVTQPIQVMTLADAAAGGVL